MMNIMKERTQMSLMRSRRIHCTHEDKAVETKMDLSESSSVWYDSFCRERIDELVSGRSCQSMHKAVELGEIGAAASVLKSPGLISKRNQLLERLPSGPASY